MSGEEQVAGFDALVGQEVDYYGVSLNDFKLDRTVWSAVEDEDDGYRSMLSDLEVRNEADSGPFISAPLARVRVERLDTQGESPQDSPVSYYYGFDGYQLVDVADGHVWLIFGTGDNNDYYPFFVFEHRPKA